MVWPDSMCWGERGMLYFTVNQLNRQPKFNNGQDRRNPPFAVMRTRVGPGPLTRR
jgi:hypothetical protein